MVKRFVDRWSSKEKEPSITSKIANIAQPSVNLKDQIKEVTQRLDAQTHTLDAAVLRFKNRDAEIFNRIVKAMAQRDQARANIYATELAEIRKVTQMLSHASLALQSVSMRMSTVSEFGDLVTVLAPAKSLLSNIRGEMSGIMPEASQELGSIGDLLTDIVGSTSQNTDIPVNSVMASADAMAILEEAEVAAESRLKAQLPEVDGERSVKRRSSIEAQGL